MEKLIFDIGLHLGEDTAYYLQKGFKVVGVDANPDAIGAAIQKFNTAIQSGQLILVNCAVCDFEGETSFNISEESIWSSLHLKVASRNEAVKNIITVKAASLRHLFNQYGVPYYCKIDIEGADQQALESLSGGTDRPPFISVETECLGSTGQLNDDEALATLYTLHRLGYNQFKLVDQASLHPLVPFTPFYGTGYFNKVKLKTSYLLWPSYRVRLGQRLGFNFLPGGTGPFGDDILARWMDFETAKATLLYHRAAYFKKTDALNYGFWCDWHAKLTDWAAEKA